MGSAEPKHQMSTNADAFYSLERTVGSNIHVDDAHAKNPSGPNPESQRPYCQRQGATGSCTLDKNDRANLVSDMRFQVNMAHTEFQSALQNARVELLLKKDSGWGVVGEIIFVAAAAVLTDGVSLVAADVGQALAAAQVWHLGEEVADVAALAKSRGDGFVGLIKNAVSAAKTPLRSKFAGYPPDVQYKVDFIRELQNEGGRLFRAIAADAFAYGDDVTLLWVKEVFSKTNVDVFSRYIDNLLAAFSSSNLDHLGNVSLMGAHAGTIEVVRVKKDNETRYAVIEFLQATHKRDSHGETWYQVGGQRFLNWIDRDLEHYAKDSQLDVHGTMRTLSVDHPVIAALPQIREWRSEGAK